MSVFKREPRTVYRVYGEDEYFGHEQPAEAGGLEVTPAMEDVGEVATGDGLSMVERARSEEEPPLSYRGPVRDPRPLAVGLLAAAVIGVPALVAVATLGRSSSRPRAAAVTASARGVVEARGGAATGGEKSGAERASRARTHVRARVETTRVTSRVGRSKISSSRAGEHRPRIGARRASVFFAGARPASIAPIDAGLAGGSGKADAATPASRATSEFGFER